MKFLKLFLISAVSAIMSVSAFATEQTSVISQPKSDYICGFTLNQNGSNEYPQNTDMASSSLEKELENIMSYSRRYNIDTIFFAARKSEGAYYKSDIFSVSSPMLFSSEDPLSLLCEKANDNNIKVYTSVNVFESVSDNPPFMGKLENQTIKSNGKNIINYESEDNLERVTDALLEIIKNYNVEGIVLTGFDSILANPNDELINNLQNYIINISSKISSYGTGKSIGISLDATFSTNNKISKMINNLCKEGYINFIVPVINSTSDNTETYKAVLFLWRYFSDTYGVNIYTQHLANAMFKPSTNYLFLNNPHEIMYQLYLNHSFGMDGSIINSYNDLKLNIFNLSESIYHVERETNLSEYENMLTKPKQELELSFSGNNVSTENNQYYITGTSDPYSTLTMNDSAVKRFTKNGIFGTLVDIKNGLNRFTFRQNDLTKTIDIFGNFSKKNIIATMQKNTAFPYYDELFYNGDIVTLSVEAPAGANISAMIDNTMYSLEPEVIKERGSSVKYSTNIRISKTLITKNLGDIVYSMDYLGKVTSCKSNGQIYVAKKSTPVVVQVSKYFGEIYNKPIKNTKIMYSLKEGARDIITSSQGDYYQLQSGGFIHKSDISIPITTQPTNLPYMNYVDNVVISSNNRSETFTLIGCEYAPFKMIYDKEARNINVIIYNTENFPVSLSYLESTLFDNIDVEILDTTINLNFHLADGITIWGTDMGYSDENTHIIFRTPPEISLNPLYPLRGITIFIDPAFGGDSRGAQSPVGENASDEADLNLINAYALMIKLKSLGANIIMSRNNDISYALDDRLKLAEKNQPDLYINLSHSSTPININPENIKGIFIYYTTDISKTIANYISDSIHNNLTNKFIYSSYTNERKQTQITYCPSISIDLGNISNPMEYEFVSDIFEIYKTSSAIAASIIDIFNMN